MNFVDMMILLILAICVLGGYYRGVVNTTLGIGATVLAWVVGLICVPILSAGIQSQQDLYTMMLYYTEGAEYVAATDVELTRTPISSVSVEQLNLIIDNADMPLPMGKCVARNIATEAFSKDGVTTLGDYFNQTIVCVVVNILSLLLIFLVVRLLLGFILRGVDYARGGFPILHRGDGVIGAGLGLIHGVLLVFVLFMLVPIALTVLPKLYVFLQESFFGEFFYKENFLIRLIPAT